MSEESREMLEAFFEPKALPATAEFLVHQEAIRDRIFERFRQALFEKVQAGRAEPWQAQLIDVAGNPARNFESNYVGLYFSTPRWQDRYQIGFQSQASGGRSMWFGIKYRNENTPPPDRHRELVIELNRSLQMSGISNNWWLWGVGQA